MLFIHEKELGVLLFVFSGDFFLCFVLGLCCFGLVFMQPDYENFIWHKQRFYFRLTVAYTKPLKIILTTFHALSKVFWFYFTCYFLFNVAFCFFNDIKEPLAKLTRLPGRTTPPSFLKDWVCCCLWSDVHMPSLPWGCGSNSSSPAAVAFGVLSYADFSLLKCRVWSWLFCWVFLSLCQKAERIIC